MAELDLSPLHDHLTAPRGRGRLAGAAHAGTAGGAPCGDLIRISVELDSDRVAEAGFDAGGCAAARAAGSAVVELVRGAPLLEAARVSPETIAEALGGLSPERRHAAELAADALHRALGAACADGIPSLRPDRRRTLVAMSGGVDSAVAARLALDSGDEVVAVTLELWADEAGDGTKSCCSPQAVTGARALAHRMGLPHITLDVRGRFRAEVVDDFLSEHAAGRTPNPCVRCNGLVRFDVMLALAERLGAARLATGHYARIEHDCDGPLLRAAVDDHKDQTYMLARLAPHELDRLSFPLGEIRKDEVRAIARSAGLPVAEKEESQDLCFLAGTDGEQFLERHGGHALPLAGGGDIVDRGGRVLGRHDGQHRFTVGQRRGIGVAGPEPLYVLEKDPRSGRVVVGSRSELSATRVPLTGLGLHRDAAQVNRVKLRYRSRPVTCRLDADRAEARLAEPVDGIAPGQTACLMRGETVVGWATIAAPDPIPAHIEQETPCPVTA
jgi:tRNA-specific 2-thiouridylase